MKGVTRKKRKVRNDRNIPLVSHKCNLPVSRKVLQTRDEDSRKLRALERSIITPFSEFRVEELRLEGVRMF